MPTYMLRGLTLDGLDDQILDLVDDAVDRALSHDPLALNLYLTMHSKTLPLVEPVFLTADFLNLVGLSPLAQIPLRLANALMPALRILTDIGYSNVVRNPDGTYTRDFTNADVETPFMSFANINYGLAAVDAFNAFLGGVHKEFFSGNPTASGPNVLKNLLEALLAGDLLGGTPSTPSTPSAPGGTPSAPANPLGALLGGLTGAVNGLLGGLLGGLFGGLGNSVAPANILASQSVGETPDLNPTFSRLSISAGAADETAPPQVIQPTRRSPRPRATQARLSPPRTRTRTPRKPLLLSRRLPRRSPPRRSPPRRSLRGGPCRGEASRGSDDRAQARQAGGRGRARAVAGQHVEDAEAREG